MATCMGLMGGRSLDLKTGYVFTRRSDRRRAIEIVVKHKPWLAVGNLPCARFSIFQNMNIHKFKDRSEWMADFEGKKAEAIKHTEFCIKRYRLQLP